MSKFQLIILSIFIVFIIGGVIAFARFKGQDSKSQLPPITVWGTFPADTFDLYVSKVNNAYSQQLRVTYVQKRPEEFSRDFIAALARGTGPDALLITADALIPHQDKITPIPYSALPQRTFLDSYVQEGTVYLTEAGALAVPFIIDPLVMYWNRDTFDQAGIATRPQYWEEFATLDKKLTLKDDKGTIRKSAVALGEFSNIGNARELLGSLFMQLGNPITARGVEGGVVSTLKSTSAANPAPALKFFTEAVDPSNPSYSWNRSMPESKTAFLSGTLATYFGFASELSDLRAKNPNINFDVAPLPQIKGGNQKATYARMYGFSIVRSSPNAGAVYQIMALLTNPLPLAELSQSLYLPSVRREVIAKGSTDPYVTIFNQSALIGRTWLDADPAQSRIIFANMVGAVTSGQRSVDQALQDAGDQYDVLLKQALQ
ncbi:MAG: extracellular solute-binding protein [Patescibacteria group bacterium]